MTERVLFLGQTRDWEPPWYDRDASGRVLVLDMARGECPAWPEGPSYTMMPGDPPEALAAFLASLNRLPSPKPNRRTRRRQRRQRR